MTRGWAPLRGVLVGREKFIDLPIVELYDLAADPKETGNAAAARPDRVRVMFQMLKMFNVAPPAPAHQETADTLERLRSLGYIGGGTVAVREKYTDADDPKRLIAIEQLMQRGNDAYRQGRSGEAIGIYKDVIVRRPDTEDAYRRLALAYWRAGDATAAVATLESALRAGVTQSEVRNKLGEYLAESGQPAKAIALLAHDAGDDPDALIALGNAYQIAGRNADAIRTFTRLIAVQKDNALAWQNLGVAQLQTKDARSAETSLRHALTLDGSLAAAHTALGVVLAQSRTRLGRHRRVEAGGRDRPVRPERPVQSDDEPGESRPRRRGPRVRPALSRRRSSRPRHRGHPPTVTSVADVVKSRGPPPGLPPPPCRPPPSSSRVPPPASRVPPPASRVPPPAPASPPRVNASRARAAP